MKYCRWIGILLVSLTGISTAEAADPPVDYLRDIKPILRAHCYACHGADQQESDLRLDTAKAAIAGGNSGPAIQPGNSHTSLLVQAITGAAEQVMQMPPEDEADALSDVEVATIRRWIDQGARYPSDEQPQPAQRRDSDHWSFQPIRRPHLPAVQGAPWLRTPVDAFVLAQLERRGIAPSAAADRPTLIRRLSLDLLGLPAGMDDVRRFVNDRRPAAYERLVDRLLASPHYGERWGRHWLDQARYADSDGYTNDVPRVMWRYRDWVIDALNQDLPFDRFTIEQIAGDLLPNATVEQQVATGFHRNTQRNREGGSDPEQYRVEAVVDRVATTGVVFLGLTLGCARCHDHKYDPVSQREFYQLFAFLNNQDEPQLTVDLGGPPSQAWKHVQQQLAAAQKELKQLDAASDESAESDPQRAALQERIKQLTSREQALSRQATTTTLVLRERSATRPTHVHIRGDFLRKGKKVEANVPAVLPPLAARGPQPNRLDLAQWLVSADNPLTARVTVNRLWQHYFGRGIVESENDFGVQGTPPTHPLLLDYLAAELVAGKWSLKDLHRMIVCSSTYRQSSRLRPELVGIDPRNTWLARQNRLRLEAECIRDTALAVSGLLSSKLKGPSVYPPQPAGVMKLTRNPNRKWVVSQGEDRYRRGLYTYFWRSTPHPFLKLFNAPESNTTCTRRERSNTPLQALTLLNDEAFVEAARALAARILEQAPRGDVEQQIDYAFVVCLGRHPSPDELQAVRQLLEAELSAPAPTSIAASAAQPFPADVGPQLAYAWTTVARTLINLDEFITRE